MMTLICWLSGGHTYGRWKRFKRSWPASDLIIRECSFCGHTDRFFG